MKALITGSLGFVGRHLQSELETNGYQVFGLDMVSKDNTIKANLLNQDEVLAVIKDIKPDAVFHLAAQADIGKSWRLPQETIQVNVIGSLNLMEAIRLNEMVNTKIVMVGSSDQYGRLGSAGVSVEETMQTKPQSPYAISKQAQEEMGKLYSASYGMKICMTRSFNHSGAGQRTGFLIPDFASGIVKIERGLANSLKVGNLTAKRDFTHVKDIVRAYRLIAEKGQAGEIYNVGSGETHSVQEVLNELCKLSVSKNIVIVQDPARMRPSDTPVICCNHDKLTRDTGWMPEIDFHQILTDTIQYYRSIT